MKPYKTLLFLTSVFVVLLTISFTFPRNGIKINDDFTIQFVKIDDLLNFEKTQYADITNIIEKISLLDDTTNSNAKKSLNVSLVDSLTSDIDSTQESLTLEIEQLSNPEKIRHLEFPNGDASMLKNVFTSLSNAKRKKELVRILHYGDSQIEGDRITALIRYKLQTKFGGSGVGLLPATQAFDYSVSIKQTASDNWNRYTIIDKTNAFSHKRFGLVSIMSKFTSDEQQNDSTIHESWIKFQKSKFTYATNQKFVQCKLLYGYNQSPVIAELYCGNKLTKVQTLLSNNTFNSVAWDLDNSVDELSIKFAGKESPEIYGIAFDDKSGVAVDNLAIRGSSGLDFTKNDPALLKQMFKQLNVKMLILEYGINIVSQKKANYEFYENWFYSQLDFLKKMSPDLTIIVIGVSDISYNNNGVYETTPQLEQIRDAQKNAAFKAGCAFWDLYEAMGGKNSMPSWATANPPLAAKDYSHFSYQGAKIVAQMFYESFIYEYNQYVLLANEQK
ncbi:MAG TPA: hypothetical protein DDX39_09610 [Bacteroidales bacterium]|nr:MAG: hypothetical protein A2W98_04105 [Bacteroidetes bacterium GWF2_33_38]OFY76076.1 MAG: hypothetical protein A2265_05885 [Bacteroidetes bacterium RIFOXYA12_FULL_33_9]OFY88531.1 MAG: hypothetical protein A2236_11255 [Bacteroidetes bacterium RIFOXYA2_FULL_33_7]HBF88885.1 hypothetical protein [Bacteroidales bacterium]